MNRDVLTNLLVCGLAGQGDIYTDAIECRSAVARAENLQRLAALLASNTPEVCGVAEGLLMANDVVQGVVGVDIEGEVMVTAVTMTAVEETTRRGWAGISWKVQLMGHAEKYPLAVFFSQEGPQWILSCPDAFYSKLLRIAEEQEL